MRTVGTAAGAGPPPPSDSESNRSSNLPSVCWGWDQPPGPGFRSGARASRYPHVCFQGYGGGAETVPALRNCIFIGRNVIKSASQNDTQSPNSLLSRKSCLDPRSVPLSLRARTGVWNVGRDDFFSIVPQRRPQEPALGRETGSWQEMPLHCSVQFVELCVCLRNALTCQKERKKCLFKKRKWI